jgi:TRAP-type mannitol/chloroaromatic compound transport system permease large subunit
MKAIFYGSTPFCVMLLITIAIIMAAPATVTYLTKLI